MTSMMMMRNHNQIPGQFFTEWTDFIDYALPLERMRWFTRLAGIGAGPSCPVLRRLIWIPEILVPSGISTAVGGAGVIR